MKRTILLAFCAVFCILAVWSCKKKKGPDPAHIPGCRVTQVVKAFPRQTLALTNTTAVYNLYYNADGTVARVAHINYESDRQYLRILRYLNGGVLALTSVEPHSGNYRDSVSLNADGKVEYMFYNDSYTSDYILSHKYEYDAGGDPVLHITQSVSGDKVDSLRWQNGDLVRFYQEKQYFGDEDKVFLYQYFDTVYNIGNICALPDDLLKYGRPVYTSRHLLKWSHIQSAADTTFYSYELDNEGKVTEIKEMNKGSIAASTLISYTCQ